MVSLTHKTFSDETMKKVHWVKCMFNDWIAYRQSREDLQSIDCNIDDVPNLEKSVLSAAICRFITEVKKVDGGEFPGRTLYDIVICLQFWIQSKGLSWRLISDEEFSDVKFTLDNVMKERTASGIGNSVRQAEVLTFT